VSRRQRDNACGRLLTLVLAAALALVGCGEQDESTGIADNYDLRDQQVRERGGGNTTRFVVGSKDFEEQQILGQITMQALEAAGAEVVDRIDLGDSEDVRRALETGEIDLYWEYTGTGALIHLGTPDPPSDPDELFTTVDEVDRRRNGIAWIARAPANNSYALVASAQVYDEGSDQYDNDLAAVRTISDLGTLLEDAPGKATICVGQEFSERADGLPGLERHYGLKFPDDQVIVLDDDAVYPAVAQGRQCAFGSVFETSGYLDEYEFGMLEDDQDFFLAYNPAVTLDAQLLEDYPDLSPLFEDIAERLDNETLRALSAKMLVDNLPASDVAEDWLVDQGLT